MRRFLVIPAFLVATVLADAAPAHARGFARGRVGVVRRQQFVAVQQPVIVRQQVVAVVRAPRRPGLIQRGVAAVRGFGRGLLRGI